MTFRQVAYKNITRNLRAYLAFYLGSSFAVMIFFVFAMFMNHPALEQIHAGHWGCDWLP